MIPLLINGKSFNLNFQQEISKVRIILDSLFITINKKLNISWKSIKKIKVLIKEAQIYIKMSLIEQWQGRRYSQQ